MSFGTLARPRTIPKWLLPWEATVAHIASQSRGAASTDISDVLSKDEARADIQPVGRGFRLGSFGFSRDGATHVGVFTVASGLVDGDLVKFETGPEAGNTFRVMDARNVENHHYEPILRYAEDETLSDVVGRA